MPAIRGIVRQTLRGILHGIARGVAISSPPTYGASGTLVSGVGALTPAVPAGLTASSVELLIVGNQWNSVATTVAATLTDAQGFVAVTGGALTSGSFGGVGSYQTVFWRRGGGTAPTVADNGEFNTARIFRFDGVVTTGTPWDVVTSAGDNSGDTTISLAGATTVTANCLVVQALTAFCNNTAANVTLLANAALGSVTERADTTIDVGGSPCNLALMTGTKAAAGLFGASSGVWDTGVYWVYAGTTIALRPT